LRTLRGVLRATETAVAAGVDLDGLPQVPAVEIGEQGVQEDQLGIGGLPEQEVRRALLAGSSRYRAMVRSSILSGLIRPSAASVATCRTASTISARPP
jgi:hypothetical protein